jgi:hypothetical protein
MIWSLPCGPVGVHYQNLDVPRHHLDLDCTVLPCRTGTSRHVPSSIRLQAPQEYLPCFLHRYSSPPRRLDLPIPTPINRRANSSSRARICLLGSGPRTALTQPHASASSSPVPQTLFINFQFLALTFHLSWLQSFILYDKQLSFAEKTTNGPNAGAALHRTRRKMGREPPLQRLNRRFPVLASIRLSSTFRAVVSLGIAMSPAS